MPLFGGAFCCFAEILTFGAMNVTWHTLRLEEMKPLALYEMLALRQAIFVVEQYCPYLDADGLDADAWHLLGYEDQVLVAYARLIPQGITYPNEASLGRVLTLSSKRGTGLGKALMQKAISTCQNLFGEVPIRISAQQYLLDFYQELGFSRTGKAYLEDGIPHLEMMHKV